MKFALQKISTLKNYIKNGMTSSESLTSECLQRIEQQNKQLNTFITTCRENALNQAKTADNKFREKKDLPLLGIPIAIKDNIITENIKTTCASRILSDFVPPYDATVIKKLKDAGAVIVGKTNLDEFAMGSSNEYSYFGPVKNPWDVRTVPGGSSGGSAAAVAARQVPVALGSDTGGSVRQPASFCGIVGLKPTYGRISRYGLVAFASSLDQIGILSTTVEDCALVAETLFGKDPRDSTSANQKFPAFTEIINKPPKGLKLGYAKEFLGKGLDPEIKDSFLNALKHFEKEGFSVEEISLPNSQYAIATYYIIANAEASANLARYDGVRYGFRKESTKDIKDMYFKTRSEGFGEEVKRRIMLGTFVLSSGYYDAYYGKAQKARDLITSDYREAFKNIDMIISPTSPTCAFEFGEKKSDPLSMYLCDIYTTSINLAGIPAISIPCGHSKKGLPIGLQIIGKPFDEENIFRLSNLFEQTTTWSHKYPRI